MIELSDITAAALSKFQGIWSNPNLRFFWFYVAVGMLIALFAHRISGDRRSFAAVFFRREVWLSRSATNDYLLLVINPVIWVVGLSWLVSNLRSVTGWIIDGFEAFGHFGAGGEGSLLIAAAMTLTLYLVNDFMRWWLHYLQHKIPVLWEFHKVHHSAEHLNFATSERFHPFDILFFSAGVILAAAIVNGLFLGIFGDRLTVWQAGGANVIFVASNLIGGVLRHSPVWVSFGPKWERWLISPAMHQIHHSSDPKHFDKNMGGGLAIWDRMGGTLYVPQAREELAFGIGEETTDYRTLRGILIGPLVKAFRLFVPNRSAGPTPGE